jgi:type I restriction enzyme R subunit
MPNALLFREELISQIPALQLLMGLGYTFLTPEEALAKRVGKLGNVLLEGVLLAWLREHNAITYKGQTYPFSEANLQQAVRLLKEEPAESGLVRANEAIYERLTLGVSLPQTIEGDTRSFSLHYIDWHNPEDNVYHVTDEFSVQRSKSDDTRRPDVVVFVNGLPLVVIECKRPDREMTGGEKAVMEAVTQHIRNQKEDEIPHLFRYSQLLLAVSKNDALCGTTATSKKFWSVWREGTDIEAAVQTLLNQPLSTEQKRALFAHRDDAQPIWQYFDDLDQAGPRLPTVQDRTLYSLLRPERLLELIYQYIVFDAGIKKIARYQQYFAIKETLARVAHRNPGGERGGGSSGTPPAAANRSLWSCSPRRWPCIPTSAIRASSSSPTG